VGGGGWGWMGGWAAWKSVSSSIGVKDCVRQDRERIWVIQNYENNRPKMQKPPIPGTPLLPGTPPVSPIWPLRFPSAYGLVHPPLHIVPFFQTIQNAALRGVDH
jgi:hypothetical protein